VILDPDSYYLWLDPGMRDVAAISELLKPYDARSMRCYPVSTRLNHVANDDEECSRYFWPPVGLRRLDGFLFVGCVIPAQIDRDGYGTIDRRRSCPQWLGGSKGED